MKAQGTSSNGQSKQKHSAVKSYNAKDNRVCWMIKCGSAWYVENGEYYASFDRKEALAKCRELNLKPIQEFIFHTTKYSEQ